MRPYIGITDFTEPDQVERILRLFDERPPGLDLKHRLGVGVMMSHKTLNGIPTKWSSAFPPNDKVAGIFIDHDDVFNVLHYADYDGQTTADDLARAIELGGPNLHALQLDMPWPDLGMLQDALGRTSKRPRIIIQVSRVAMEQVKDDLREMARRVTRYYNAHSLDYVLLDRSMGRGETLNPSILLDYWRAIRREHLSPLMVGIAIAGGLGPENLDLLYPIRKVLFHESFSIDAQSKLRPSGNALDPIDWDMAKRYFTQACLFFGWK